MFSIAQKVLSLAILEAEEEKKILYHLYHFEEALTKPFANTFSRSECLKAEEDLWKSSENWKCGESILRFW